MRSLWRDDVSVHEGTTARLDPSWSWPKTVRREGPRVLVGAQLGPQTVDAIAGWADGWMPIGSPTLDLDGGLDALRTAFERAGRDPAAVYTSMLNAPADPAELNALVERGVQAAAFTVWAEEAGDVERRLDLFAEVVASFDAG